MLFRSFNPDMVDIILNHPSVRPTAEQGTHRLCSAEIVNDTRNLALVAENGLALFLGRGGKAYEGHIYVVEGHRGAGALALGRAALAELFGRYEASKCLASVPLQLREARFLVRRLGFTGLGVDPDSGIEHFVMETLNGRAS